MLNKLPIVLFTLNSAQVQIQCMKMIFSKTVGANVPTAPTLTTRVLSLGKKHLQFQIANVVPVVKLFRDITDKRSKYKMIENFYLIGYLYCAFQKNCICESKYILWLFGFLSFGTSNLRTYLIKYSIGLVMFPN